MPLASILTWMERRQSAMMQDRLGPNRANIGPFKAWGITHFLADALKFMFKEDFVPPQGAQVPLHVGARHGHGAGADRRAIIPFGSPLCWGQLIGALRPDDVCAQPVLAADRAARRRHALLLRDLVAGGLRRHAGRLGLAQQVGDDGRPARQLADDVLRSDDGHGGARRRSWSTARSSPAPSSLSSSTSRLDDLRRSWGIFTQPLGFLLFLTAAIAETKRTPFDIPEGEPEIIGYFVEYSGLRFGMFFLGEFLEIVFSSAIIITLFFGGWQLPGLTIDGFADRAPLAATGSARAGDGRDLGASRSFLFCCVPAADPLVAAALPLRSADAARLAAAAADLDRQRRR